MAHRNDPFFELAEAEIAKQYAECQRLRAEVRKLRWLVVTLFVVGSITWLAGLLGS